MADKILEKLVVEIRTDQKKLNREMNQLKGGMKKQGEKLGSSFTSGFGSMIKGIGASIVLSQTISFVKKSIDLYMKQEAAEKRLSVAYGKNIDNLKEYASALQAKTAYGDEDIIDAQALIAAFVKEEDAIKRATKATLDLAAAKGMDLKVAADLLSKTLGSSTNALSRYGIEVTGAVGSAERLNSAMENLNAKFGGQAEAQLETYTGRIQAMSNAFGDLLEVLGKGSLEYLFAGVQALFSGGGVVGFSNNLMKNRLNDDLSKFAKGLKEEYAKNVPDAITKTVTSVSSITEEIKKLEDQLSLTNITDIVSRDKLKALIEAKQKIISEFLNPIMNMGIPMDKVTSKGAEFNLDGFKSKSTDATAQKDQWYVDLWQSKGKPALEETKNMWVDIGQAQSVAMGNLISGWTSAISLFKNANSLLEQMIDNFAQIAIQQLALSAIGSIGSFIGGVFSGDIGFKTGLGAINSSIQAQTSAMGSMNKGVVINAELDSLRFTQRDVNTNQKRILRGQNFGN